eukprot:TRINITY_DN260_c1_g2_i1.p1 TRINITY_DN260_c1_g2~~TRINITY_DN260_c1_g2_i1.p1  ORF type:complete len:422 (+),score=38.89 TRINITY_DN260_c1_g2_i1:57-1322(+)
MSKPTYVDIEDKSLVELKLSTSDSLECSELKPKEQSKELIGVSSYTSSGDISTYKHEVGSMDNLENDNGGGIGQGQVWWQRLAPYFAILIAAFIFSGMQVFANPMLEYIPPQTLTVFRLSIALLPLFLLARFNEGTPTFSRQGHLAQAVMGIFIALAQSLVFYGNHLAGPDIVAVMQPAIPIYVSLYSMILKLENFSWWKIVGQGLAVVGCLVLVRVDHLDFGNSVAVGTIIEIFQTMSYAAFLILMAWHTKTYPYPFTAFFRVTAWGWGILLVFNLVTMPRIEWAEIPWWAWVGVAYCGVWVSFIGHMLMTWSVSKVQAVIPALSTCLQPVLTSILAAVVLGQYLGVRDIFAMFTIIAGLVVVVLIKLKESKNNNSKQQLYQDIKEKQVEKQADTDDLQLDLEMSRLLPVEKCDMSSSSL